MSDCVCLEGCPFFNDKMANMPSMAEILKQRYCRNDWQDCARHKVFEEFGRDAVPGDLFPNEVERSEQILAELRGA